MAVAAAAEINTSEEILKQRVRENLKYLEELGISRDVLAIANREYKLWVDDPKDKQYYQRRSTNQSSTREYTGRIASDGQKADAVKRAEELQRDLNSHHPSFIKPMVRSHVSGGFWLGLPTRFCKENLPPIEWKMVLEDEQGNEHLVLYLGRKNGLSGGWRGFAIDHNLEDGDVLVFELSQPARFKVHIIKAIQEDSRKTSAAKSKKSSSAKKEDRSQKRAQMADSGQQAQRATKRGRKW